MWMALVLAPLQMVLGDLHGLNTLNYQPTKLAAMEGLWDSGRGVAVTLHRLAGHEGGAKPLCGRDPACRAACT